jgi:hypothetical protein
VDAYVNILRRLALFLGKVPPELIMGALFAVPAMLGFLAGLPWIVGLLIDGFVMWYLTTALFKAHVWPETPPEHKRLLLVLRAKILFLPPGQDASDSPKGDESQ